MKGWWTGEKKTGTVPALLVSRAPRRRRDDEDDDDKRMKNEAALIRRRALVVVVIPWYHLFHLLIMMIGVLLLIATFCIKVEAFTSPVRISSAFDKLERLNSICDINEDCSELSSTCINRLTLLISTLHAPFIAATVPIASAANLPQNTGADLSKTGTIDTLIPIVAMKQSLESINSQLMAKSGKLTLDDCKSALKTLQQNIPRDENEFKRMFDAYSTPVSYKQKFLDQNAFLVCE